MSTIPAVQFMAQAATTTTPVTTTTPEQRTTAQAVADAAAWITPQTFAALLVALIAIVTIFALVLIYRHVKDSNTKWSLADALSEEAAVGPVIKNKADELVLDKDNNVQYTNEMRASSSRLIALLGSIAIMMLYIGAGLSVLYTFASGGGVPKETKEFTTFFLYGMVLFAPYVVNKFSNIFSWLK